MVKIEILPNIESNFTTNSNLARSRSKDYCTFQHIQHLANKEVDSSYSPYNDQNSKQKTRIQTLAEACAATSIQAFWRGKYQQIHKYCMNRKDPSFRRPPTPADATKERCEKMASITIKHLWQSKKVSTQQTIKTMQKKELTPETKIQSKNSENVASCINDCKEGDAFFKIQSPIAPELFSKGCTRREVIMKARNISSSRRKEISLRGTEITKIFKDMELVSSEEYEGIMKIVADIEKEDGGSGIYYNITLVGPIVDFQKQLATAWIIFTQKAHISQTMALKKAAKLKLDLVATKMRSHILDLVDLQEESLSFLINNPGVMQYSKDCIKAFLQTTGIHNVTTTKGNIQWILLNYLKKLENRAQSAFLRGRIQTMIELVYLISQWESAGDCNHLNNKEHDSFLERNIEDHRIEIAHLRRELEAKNKCIADLSHESKILKKRVGEGDNRQHSSDSNQSGETNFSDLFLVENGLSLYPLLLLISS